MGFIYGSGSRGFSKRLNEFLKIEPEIKNNNENSSDIEGNITFENVSFTYKDTNIEALKNVSFTVKKEKL